MVGLYDSAVGTSANAFGSGVTTSFNDLAPLFLGLGIGDEQKQKVDQLPMPADGLLRKAEETKVQLRLTQ